jgi:uncharacterized cupredoxin-like copper-binding protein
MKTRRAFALGAALLATTLVAGACGDDSSSTGAVAGGRVIEISMTDMAYGPANISAANGETVTFRFRNNGQAIHEAVIGDDAYQMDHGSSMTGTTMSNDGHGMGHGGMGADNMVTVKPGKTGEVTYRFDESGTFIIGCHQPGHYEAGMKANVNVT